MAEKSAMGRKLSQRFVAGLEPEDVLHVTQELNKRGLAVSMDNLGENVTNAEQARHSGTLYHQLLDQIAARNLEANVSLKLTHMGLDVDEALAQRITGELVTHAAGTHNFVRVDMEGSPYTERTLKFVQQLHGRDGNGGRVGAVIQAYLKRSESDVAELVRQRIRIRLCKGAYKEPAEIAFQKKSEVDANYVKLMKILLKSGVYHGIATHDPNMISATIDFARAESISPSTFEFQMLYGIRRDLQHQLVKDGWRMRVYVPFGTEWYPYFMRRLAERPANVLFVLRNLFQ